MAPLTIVTFLLVTRAAAAAAAINSAYTLDDSLCAKSPGSCKEFHGVGAISGGGATSVFLRAYPEPYRSQILDYLFKPGFGASLQILKVEIGSDAETTDGAEASHMRTPWDENYQRGYEWWLMQEAKARNPDIKLYGLAWGFPVWITCAYGFEGCEYTDPFQHMNNTAQYITKWVEGARSTYGLKIDYIGSWNERYFNTTYLKVLRASLDAAGLNDTLIVAPDGEQWDIAPYINADPELAASVWALGAHYPGTMSTPAAVQTGKPLFASEDSSTFNNDIGGGCWARSLNQNYVNGNITASICWNLAAAYPKGTHWYRAGLMNALTPWSGGYGTLNVDGSWTAGPMIWATAHTTQFAQPGWVYLPQQSSVSPASGSGSGFLVGGGSFVTLVDYGSSASSQQQGTGSLNVTIVVEKMSFNRSACVRPGPVNTTEPVAELATFTLSGSLAAVTSLYVWHTHWAAYDGDKTVEFESLPSIPVVNGRFSLNISVDSVYTLTTVASGSKGSFGPPPPPPTLFPAAHTDDFNDCPVPSEAPYFSDQNGALECYDSGDPAHGIVMRQAVPAQVSRDGKKINRYNIRVR